MTLFPYWLLFAAFALGSVQYHRKGPIGVQSTPILAAAGMLAALMIGFRYETGGDWTSYLEIFSYISYLDFYEAVVLGDPGYSALNWAVSALGLKIWAVNLVCGTIFTWGLLKFARRQPNPWLAATAAIPYLVIVVAMGYSRQGVAIGLVLAGLAVLDRSSLLKFSIYILLAALFHKSAVIVVPIAAFSVTQNRIGTIGIMLSLAAVLFYSFVSSSLDKLFINYVDAEYSSEGAAIRVTMNLVPAALFLLFQRRFNLSEDQRLLWRNFSLGAFAMLALLLTIESSTAVDRLALYLIPLQLFVLSRLPDAFPDKGRQNGQVVLIVLAYSALIQFVWLNYASHSELWLPYKVYPLGTV